jgi:hypothetical protein
MKANGRGGLCIKLSEEHPTLIKIGGEEVRVYLSHNADGKPRARFLASEEVEIIGPHRMKRALNPIKVIQE